MNLKGGLEDALIPNLSDFEGVFSFKKQSLRQTHMGMQVKATVPQLVGRVQDLILLTILNAGGR